MPPPPTLDAEARLEMEVFGKLLNGQNGLSHQALDRDREVAYAHSCRMIDGVCDRGRDARDGDLTHASCADAADVEVRNIEKGDVNLGNVGVDGKQIVRKTIRNKCP